MDLLYDSIHRFVCLFIKKFNGIRSRVCSCTVFPPGAPLTNFNDRRVRQSFIYYTQKSHNFRICLPQKSLLFSITKKSLSPFFTTQKNPSFFHNPKILVSFIDPKELLLAKISNPKKSLGDPLPPHH